MSTKNQYQQPIGSPLPDWVARPRPEKVILTGHWCRLEPLATAHSQALFDAWQLAEDQRDWSYLSIDRPATPADCDSLLAAQSASHDPLFFAVIDLASGSAVGSVSLLRIDSANGVLEIGWVNWTPLMQRSRCSTEAIALLLSYTFDQLGYRRCEWKCHSLNIPSNRAARRLGFQYEGTFRQAVVSRGHNRDTCWYSIIDKEWPQIRAALAEWLSRDNFTADGQQQKSLSAFMPSL